MLATSVRILFKKLRIVKGYATNAMDQRRLCSLVFLANEHKHATKIDLRINKRKALHTFLKAQKFIYATEKKINF